MQKEKGDIFERYCLDLLLNEKVFSVKKAWLWNEYPYKHRYKLESVDTGVDIVGHLLDGGVLFVQAKYRSGSLKWGEVSNTEALARRNNVECLIITNTKRISKNLRNSGLRIVCGLDPLLINYQLGQKYAPTKPIVLRDYQKDCIRNIKNNTGKMLLGLSCGLGKTIIAAKGLGSVNTIIFAPTLYLLDSIGRTFLKENSYTSALMIGCESTLENMSEDSLEDPDFQTPFLRTTDLDQIKNFIEKEGTKLVLCTYTSYLLASKFEDHLKNWCIVYDECHRVNFDEIQGKKTLYVSASPLQNQLDFCRIDSYSFSDAVSDGRLATFDIYLSLVGNVNGYLENPVIKTFFEGFEHSDRVYTMGIGLSIVKAVLGLSDQDSRNCRKVLVYSNTNARSKVLKNLVAKLFDFFSVEIPCYYTDSKSTLAARFSVVDTFLAQPRALLFTCRIFSEGVDVPMIDSVIFAESRKSRRDVIQSVGRCLRVAKEKSLGKVLEIGGGETPKELGLYCKSWVILPCLFSEQEFETTQTIIRTMTVMDPELKAAIRKGTRISIGGKRERIMGDNSARIVEWSKKEFLSFYDSIDGKIVKGYSNSEEAANRFYEEVKNINYIALGNYTKSNKKVEIKCDKNHTFFMVPNAFMCGQRCPKCSRNCPERAKENFYEEVSKRGYIVLGEYEKAIKKWK